MKLLVHSVILSATILFFASCQKAGLGGDATLVVYVQHHGNTIPNHVGWPDTIFVKFKATELPGTNPSDFDTFFVGEAGEDHVHCHGLKSGKYFLYATAMDSAGPYHVTGGLALTIKFSERKKEIKVDIRVSED